MEYKKHEQHPLTPKVYGAPLASISWPASERFEVLGYHGFPATYPTSQPALQNSAALTLVGVPTTDKYMITVGNDASVDYNLAMRTRPCQHSIPQHIRNMAINYVVSMLDGALTKPVPLGDIELTPQGASGIGYSCCANKITALRNHWDVCLEYSRNYKSHSPPLWTYMHKKGEALKKEKAENMVRPIIYSPMHFYTLQKIHTQELDDRIKTRRNTWFSYGKNVLGRHFTDVWSELSGYSTLFKGDCTKFDSGIGPDAFSVICDIRKRLSAKTSHEALDFIYTTLSQKYIRLPNSAIVRDTRQPSGQACTTSDNSLFHCFVLVASYLLSCEDRGIQLGDYHARVRDNLHVFLYSDDHIGATNDLYFSQFEVRAKYYALFGLLLKREDDQVGGYITSYTYLGGLFSPLPHLPGCYGYSYNDPDLLPLLHLVTFKSRKDEVLQTLHSYARICALDKRKYLRVKQIHDSLRALPGWPDSPDIVSRAAVISAFCSLE